MPLWKVIAGFSSYEVSDDGQVRSQSAVVSNRWGPYNRPQRILKAIEHDGYRKVILYNDSRKRIVKRVCRLVLEAFTSGANGRECNHKNGIRNDDRLDNLEWTGHAENCLHRCRVLNNIPLRGKKRRYLSHDDLDKVATLHASGNSFNTISKSLGISRSKVKKIITNTK